MPKYQVPQFIEEEAKIIGPLTLEQFVYIGVAGGIVIISFYLFGTFLWMITSAIAGTLGVALAFIKINGQKLPQIVLSALQYWRGPKKFVWKRETPTTTLDVSSLEKIKAMRRNMSFQEKLKSAALNIATGKFSLFSKERGSRKKPKEKYQVVTHATGERSLAKKVDYPKK